MSWACRSCMRFVADHEGECESCRRYGSDVLHPYDLWWVWSFSANDDLRFQCVEAALDKHRQHPDLLTLHRRPSAFAELRFRKLRACAAYGQMGSEQELTRGGFLGARLEPGLGDEFVSYDAVSAYPHVVVERLEDLGVLKLVRPEGER